MSTTETPWANSLHAITLFVEDINRTKRFYEDIFGLPKIFEDNDSVVFKVGGLLLNFLKISEAEELISPAKVGKGKSAPRFVMTIQADNVDARCKTLKALGANLLTAPIDRPWGIRSANFTDPDGYIWEIATPNQKPG